MNWNYRAGMQCIGSDINGDCIEGAAVNLRYALNETFTSYRDGRLLLGTSWQLELQAF